jgi:hypothetical protein
MLSGCESVHDFVNIYTVFSKITYYIYIYASSVKVTIGHNTPDALHVGSPWPSIRMKYTYS